MKSYRDTLCEFVRDEARFLCDPPFTWYDQDSLLGFQTRLIQYVNSFMKKAYVAGHIAGVEGALNDFQRDFPQVPKLASEGGSQPGINVFEDRIISERKFETWVRDV